MSASSFGVSGPGNVNLSFGGSSVDLSGIGPLLQQLAAQYQAQQAQQVMQQQQQGMGFGSIPAAASPNYAALPHGGFPSSSPGSYMPSFQMGEPAPLVPGSTGALNGLRNAHLYNNGVDMGNQNQSPGYNPADYLNQSGQQWGQLPPNPNYGSQGTYPALGGYHALMDTNNALGTYGLTYNDVKQDPSGYTTGPQIVNGYQDTLNQERDSGGGYQW